MRFWIAVKARLFAGTAATLWLIVALSVALPREFATGRFSEAGRLFFHDFHFVFVTFLVLVDVVIGVVFLEDTLMKRAVAERAVWFVAVLALEIAVSVFAGLHYGGVPPEPIGWAIFFSASVWLMRLWSFSGAYVAIPISVITES